MLNFEMTCYYVASNLPAHLNTEHAAGTDIADNAEFEEVGSYEVFGRVAQR